MTDVIREPAGSVGSKAKRNPEICGNRPAVGQPETPFSSACHSVAPVMVVVAAVLPKGSTEMTSPSVTSYGPVEPGSGRRSAGFTG
ncbi:unannotated protein [freshwater metagenome]|uniref:Unannotated protein n=1 Tax=freshwater metagenome TaxID=449393 RepID=A0A6J7NE97_9ZZZZ